MFFLYPRVFILSKLLVATWLCLGGEFSWASKSVEMSSGEDYNIRICVIFFYFIFFS